VKRRSAEKKNSLKPQREKQFDDYFLSVFGERWPALKEALKKNPRHEVLRNPFAASLQDYSLDAASLLPPKHLAVKAGDKIADFCASPGGKSLALIFALNGEAHWHCNDLSPGRVQRLKAVFHDCLPQPVLARVEFSRGDASRWGLSKPSEFDRILVDAPCSGERHLLASPYELSRWSLKGAKGLVVRQNALLCSALDCLKPGGRAVYSTCSINPMENDGVIARLHKSRPGAFRVVNIDENIGEPTEFGWIVLPDRFDCGPIYFSVLEKLEGADG